MMKENENMNSSSSESDAVSRASENRFMSSTNNHELPPGQFTGTLPLNCLICGKAAGEQRFCRIQVKDREPILLCCPECMMRYLDFVRVPAGTQEQELRNFENSVHLFIGEDKPWSSIGGL